MSTLDTDNSAKRFFKLDDGADYLVVARSPEHAEQILRDTGLEFSTEGLPYDAAKARGLLSWEELPADRALTKLVHLNDQTGDNPVPLTQCEIGDWFCSEW
jgi:hypothetical protein